MPWPLPSEFDIPANHAAERTLASRALHAHSDLAEYVARLEGALPRPADVGSLVPSPPDYSYEIRFTDQRVVFMLLYGQRGVALRLPPHVALATDDAALEHDPVLGEYWYRLEWPDARTFRRWYLPALDHGRLSVPQFASNPVDLNAACAAYSHAMGNRMSDLREWAESLPAAVPVESIAIHLADIQRAIYAEIDTAAGAGGLADTVAASIATDYCDKHLTWIGPVGVDALLRWLHWMCWHEGIYSGAEART